MQDKSVLQTVDVEHWASFKEAGTLYGMQFMLFVYRIFGRKIFSIIVYPVSLYFVLCRPAARQASKDYLLANYTSQPEQWEKQPGLQHSIIHFKHFAETILDKLLAWVDDVKEDDFIIEDQTLVEDIMSDKRGQLVIGSHFGNLEFARGFMQRYRDKVINILVHDKHSANFVNMMKKLNPDSRLNIYQVDEFDVQTMLLLKDKTDRGEWVFIAGDRIPLAGLQHTVEVSFLGKKAPLPIGAYILAKALACPVKLMFAYRRPDLAADKVYFSIYKLADKVHFNRSDRIEKIQEYAQTFINELQRHSLLAPYQWFNFYEFWSLPQNSKKSIRHV